jgi:DNA polymerase III subunit gamma/tau
MSYLVLARKYRPKNFAQMVGQEHVVQALSNALTQQRLHHAYLFTGTRGVGKTTVSRILAKSLNCTGTDGQGGITAEPCGQCDACRDIDAGRFVDYTELDAASNRGVDEIAQLLEQAVYKPVQGRFKVFMIDEVHMLSNTAFNAMLKTLEEPPEYLKFVLATTDPQKVPVTVLSRCLQFNLRPMAPETVQAHLQQVLASENIGADEGALQLLSRASRGSMRDALSLTDQAIAFGAGQLSQEGVRQMLGAVDATHVRSLVVALAVGDGAQVVGTVDALRDQGLSAASTLEQMTSLLQRMAVYQLAPQAIKTTNEEDAQTAALAQQLPADETQLLYSLCLHGRAELGLAPDEYAALTMVLLRLLAFKPGATDAKPDAAFDAQRSASPTPASAGGAGAAPKKPLPTLAPPQVAQLPSPSHTAPQPARTPAFEASSQNGASEPNLEPKLPHPGVNRTHDAIKSVANDMRPPGPPSAPVSTVSIPVRELAEPSERVERPNTVPAQAQGHTNPVLDDAWAKTVQQLLAAEAVTALARELALQSQLVAQSGESGQERWTLQVDQSALTQPSLRDKLQAALATVGIDVALVVQTGPVADSLAKRQAAAQAAQLERATQIILQDEFVQQMQREFGAKIVPGSIKAA